MKNINLKNKDLQKGNNHRIGITHILSAVVLVVVFLLYGIFFLMKISTVSATNKVLEEIDSLNVSFKGGEFAEVHGFNNKLINLKDSIGTEGFLPQTKNIIEISKNTLPEIVLAEFSLDDKGGFFHYNITVVTPDYQTLVRQIKSYKKIDNLSNFFLEVAEKPEDILTAGISFDLSEVIVSEESSVDDLREPF